MIPKFRVWDKVLKKMLYSITIPKDCVLSDGAIDIFKMFRDLEKRYDFMQFTELKDKNDNEIFEGDIVKYNLTSLNKTIKGFVVFARGGYFIMTDGRNENINLFDKPKHLIEVLGNIYENPELLEKR